MNRAKGGFTLLELIITMALVTILCATAIWGSQSLLQRWQLQRGAQQLHNDLKTAQHFAETRSAFTLSEGRLVTQKTYLVFQPEHRQYALYLWQDRNQDGQPDAAETDEIWQRQLTPGVQFGWQTAPQRKACSNVKGTPTRAVTFATPNYPPCNDQPCIKFDHLGFSEIGPGGIYLHDGDQSMAITGTRPGHFTMCRWDGTRWR